MSCPIHVSQVLGEVLERFKPDAMQFHAPGVHSPSVVSDCHAHSAMVVAQCTSLAEAKAAAASGKAYVLIGKDVE